MTNNSDRKQIQKSLSFTCGLEVHPFDVLNVELVQTANDIEMMSSKPIFCIFTGRLCNKMAAVQTDYIIKRHYNDSLWRQWKRSMKRSMKTLYIYMPRKKNHSFSGRGLRRFLAEASFFFYTVSIDTDSRCQLIATKWLLTPTRHMINRLAEYCNTMT